MKLFPLHKLMKIRLSALKETAKSRPDGYYETVLSKGTIQGNVLVITPSAYQELLKQYNPAALVPPAKTCCGTSTSSTSQPAIVRPKPTTTTRTTSSMPPLTHQAINLAKSLNNALTHFLERKELLVEQDLEDKRLAICAGCEFYDSVSKRCKECGCYTKAKVKLASEKCPVGKW